MKKILIRTVSTLALGIVATFAAPASATSGYFSGTVRYIKIQSTGSGGSFFTLNSTTTVGNCAKDGSNTLALFPDDDRGKAMISVVNAALLSGKSITVMVDDRNGPYCLASYVVLAP
jgi:hypothetical protein